MYDIFTSPKSAVISVGLTIYAERLEVLPLVFEDAFDLTKPLGMFLAQ